MVGHSFGVIEIYQHYSNGRKNFRGYHHDNVQQTVEYHTSQLAFKHYDRRCHYGRYHKYQSQPRVEIAEGHHAYHAEYNKSRKDHEYSRIFAVLLHQEIEIEYNDERFEKAVQHLNNSIRRKIIYENVLMVYICFNFFIVFYIFKSNHLNHLLN